MFRQYLYSLPKYHKALKICIGFIRLLQQNSTNLGAYTIETFSLSSEGWKSESKVLPGPCSFKGVVVNLSLSLPASGGSRQP